MLYLSSYVVRFYICSFFHYCAELRSGLRPHTDFTPHQCEGLRGKHISHNSQRHKLHSPISFSISWTQGILHRRACLRALFPSPVCVFALFLIPDMACKSIAYLRIQKRAPLFPFDPLPKSSPPSPCQPIPQKCYYCSSDSPC